MRLIPGEAGLLAEADGRALHVRTAGDPLDADHGLLVLLHGVGHSGRVWEPVAEHFAEDGWGVMSVDLPGHGESAGDAVDTIADLARLVAALIDASPRGRAHIVGHSMGGVVALEVAAERPDLVEALVVIGSAAALPVNTLLLEAAASGDGSAVDLLNRWGHSRTAAEETRAFTRSLLTDVTADVLHTSLVACNTYATGVEAARRVTAPTLIVTGEHDVMIDSCELARLELALDQATSKVIPGAGHNVVGEEPELVISALEEFLEAQSSSG